MLHLCRFSIAAKENMRGRYVKYNMADTLIRQSRRGHYGRALEEAMLSQKSQWPRRWNQVNPLRGDKTFANMVASERVRKTYCLFVSEA